MKLIPLSQGQFAVVDDSDYEWLNQWKWHARKRQHTFYAYRAVGPFKNQIKIAMHRLILGIEDSNVLPDHIDGNGLNNQRHNLREASLSQNQANRKVSKSKSSSTYLGVYWNKVNKNWYAQVLRKHVGTFNDEKEAALAYNREAKIIHGEFARLNIII